MPSVFLWIAISQALLFAATAAFGLLGGDPAHLKRHVALALFTSLLACLLHAMVFTYFAVTGKLIHQAVALGRLSPEPFEQVRRFKKRITSLVGAAMLSIVVAVGTGAWRLSGTRGPRWHLLAAAAAMAVNLAVFYRQYDLIFRAHQTLSEVLREYRLARGAGQDASKTSA